jgi:hypothetical protein
MMKHQSKIFQLNSTLIFAVALVALACSKQTVKHTIRPLVDSLVSAIDGENILTSGSVGYAGAEPEQWRRYQLLCSEATDDELSLLTDHKNPVVRCYSFQALAGRKNVDVFPILLNHLDDTAELQTFFGCINMTELAGDYFLDVVTPRYIDSTLYKLTAQQKRIVDSILLNRPGIKLNAKSNLLSDLPPREECYTRIKQIAMNEGSSVAVLALARFNRQGDIEFIKQALTHDDGEYYAIYAIREFPDSSFFPLLVRVFEREWEEKLYDYSKWRILYQALAKYPCRETYSLFERTIKTKDSFRYQTLGMFLELAISKYPNPIFEPLRQQIKLDKYHLDDLENQKNSEPAT